jgi:hypothetical protein
VKESKRLRGFLQILGLKVKRIFAGGLHRLFDGIANNRHSAGSLSETILKLDEKTGFRPSPE